MPPRASLDSRRYRPSSSRPTSGSARADRSTSPSVRTWQAVAVEGVRDELVESWLTLPEVAQRLGVSVNKVRQLARDHELATVRRANEPMVPAAFLAGGGVVKGLSGTLVLLTDHGLRDDEAVEWLFS